MNKNDKTVSNSTEDMTLEEFDEWFENNDLGSLIPEGQSVMIINGSKKSPGRPRIGKKITLTLPPETIEDLRKRAAKKGMGYQTFVRMVLMELPPDEDRMTGT